MRRSSESTQTSTPMLTPSYSKSSMSSQGEAYASPNEEVLKRSGIQPPSYDSVVSESHKTQAHRSIIPNETAPPLRLDPHMMAKLNESREDLSDADEFFDLTPRGTMRPNAEMEMATEVFVSKWKSKREWKAAEKEEKRRRKQERKAEKAARKVEKYMERAERWAERAAVRESRIVY